MFDHRAFLTAFDLFNQVNKVAMNERHKQCKKLKLPLKQVSPISNIMNFFQVPQMANK